MAMTSSVRPIVFGKNYEKQKESIGNINNVCYEDVTGWKVDEVQTTSSGRYVME